MIGTSTVNVASPVTRVNSYLGLDVIVALPADGSIQSMESVLMTSCSYRSETPPYTIFEQISKKYVAT